MINFNKFIVPKQAVVPVISHTFQFERKEYSLIAPDGWWLVEISGNQAKPLEPTLIETKSDIIDKKSIIKGYTYNNSIVFQNFDVARKKFNLDVMTSLYLSTCPTFTSIEAIYWEDKKLYYLRPNYSDLKIYEVSRNCLTDGSGDVGGIKGVTPELKMVFLFHSIERQNAQKLLQEAERKSKEVEFKKSIPGRLYFSFKAVGADILNYVVERNRIIVDWKLYTGQEFNSVIDANTFRVIEAGYCMSGADRDHSVASMVLTADDYQKRRLIHKTRVPGNEDEDDEWDE